MRARRLSCLLFVVMVVSLFANLTIVTASSDCVQDSNALRAAQQHAAENAWGRVEDWQGSSVEDGVALYDAEGQLVGWGFNVAKGHRELGYIIVSTVAEPYTVVEFGVGSGLPFDKLLPEAKTSVAAHTSGTIVEHKYIYSMVLSYGVEFAIAGKEEPTYWLNDAGILSKEQFPKINRVNAQPTHNSASIQAVTEERFLSSVPDYTWHRGCSPTAAANQLGYLYYRYGYTNLPLGNTLIDELADVMNTSSTGATPRPNIGPGMVTVLASHGYSGFTSQLDGFGTASSTFSEFRSEIQANRSVHCIIQSDSEDWYYDTDENDPGLQAHSVTGMGYRMNSDGSQWVAVHDTWPQTPTEVYLRYGSVEFGDPQWVYLDGPAF